MLANELFLMAHDDQTGKPRLNARSAGIGLAAALLAELIMAQKITIRGGAIVVCNRSAPSDALAHTTVDQIVAEPQHHAVRTWLAFLGQEAADAVGQRLARSGIVRREIQRRVFKQQASYVPADPESASWPWVRLRLRLARSQPMDEPDIVLSGLVSASGLDEWDDTPGARQYLGRLMSYLPPPMQELIAETEALVGDGVLNHRI